MLEIIFFALSDDQACIVFRRVLSCLVIYLWIPDKSGGMELANIGLKLCQQVHVGANPENVVLVPIPVKDKVKRNRWSELSRKVKVWPSFYPPPTPLQDRDRLLTFPSSPSQHGWQRTERCPSSHRRMGRAWAPTIKSQTDINKNQELLETAI